MAMILNALARALFERQNDEEQDREEIAEIAGTRAMLGVESSSEGSDGNEQSSGGQ